MPTPTASSSKNKPPKTDNGSLTSIVSTLFRASLGSTAEGIKDEDLDKHVADLLLKDAKEKEAKWKLEGVKAYRDSDDELTNIQRRPTNKRFLNSIIRNVDDHNQALLRQEAEAARRREREEAQLRRRERRDRDGHRSEDRERRNHPRTDQSRDEVDGGRRYSRREYSDDDEWERERDEGRAGAKRRDRYSDDAKERRGDGEINRDKEGRDRRDDSPRHRNRHKRRDSDEERRDRVEHRRSDKGKDEGKGKERERRFGDEGSEAGRRDQRSRKESRKAKTDGIREESHPSTSTSAFRSPSPTHPRSPSRSPPPISKMDKYFNPDYDPRLDVSYADLTDPSSGLISESPFEHWNQMLDVVKSRKEDKNIIQEREREREKETERREKEERRRRKEEKRKRRKRKRGHGGSEDESDEMGPRPVDGKGRSGTTRRTYSDDERGGRTLRTYSGDEGGDGKIDVMGVKYVKRGTVREWDLGKEAAF